MKFIKDFFYDKNDIVLAIIILALAGSLIFWRLDIIMDYPSTLISDSGSGSSVTESNKDKDKDKPDKSESTTDTGNGIWSGGKLSKDVTVTIAGGSATSAVQSLIDKGLLESYEEYEQLCKASVYDPLSIKATTFTFKAGSTKSDIVYTITK